MALVIPRSLTPKKVHVAGDSITHGNFGGLSPGAWGWPDAPGGLFDQMTAASSALPPASRVFGATFTGAPATIVGNAPLSQVVPTQTQIPTFTKFGIGGAHIHDCLASMALYVLNYSPDFLILEFAINDYFDWNNGGRLQSFVDQHFLDYTAVVDQAKAALPALQVLGLGCWLDDETWGSAPPRWLVGLPLPSVNPIDLNIQAIAAARSSWMQYFPMGDWAMAYEMATTVEPGVHFGNLALDGIHPNLNGQVNMGSQVITNFVFTSPGI